MTGKDMRITAQLEAPHQRELEKYCERVEQMENVVAHVVDPVSDEQGNIIKWYGTIFLGEIGELPAEPQIGLHTRVDAP